MKVQLLLIFLVGTSAYDDHYDRYYSDDSYNNEWGLGRLSQPKCVEIPDNMTLCKDIGYNQMRLPNLLDHDTLREASSQAQSWRPLLGISCHPDTKIFLCSLFSPVCMERAIWPCRSLCESVKQSCENYMAKYGYPWPEMLRCDKFPTDNDLCIGMRNLSKNDDRKCSPCNKADTFESIVDNYCSADFVIRMQVEDYVITNGDGRIALRGKKRFYKQNNLKKHETRQPTLYVEGGQRCDCPLLDNARTNRVQLLVMGHKQGDRLMVSFLQEFKKDHKALKDALRTMRRKQEFCKPGVITQWQGDKNGLKKPAESTPTNTSPQPVKIEQTAARRLSTLLPTSTKSYDDDWDAEMQRGNNGNKKGGKKEENKQRRPKDDKNRRKDAKKQHNKINGINDKRSGRLNYNV